MGGQAGGGMGSGPRPLFQQGSAASAAGIGQPSAPTPPTNGGGMGMLGQMAPAIMQSMQQGNMNPLFSNMIGRALSGGFGGGQPQGPQGGMATQPGRVYAQPMPARTGVPGAAPISGMVSGMGLPGESRNMIGAPMQFGAAQPNPLMNRGGGGFATPGVPFINRPPPITNNPNAIPPAMQNPQPLFPTNPGSPAPQPTPGQPARQPGPAAGLQNAGRIAALQQMIANPDQSAPIALLHARRELAQLTGG